MTILSRVEAAGLPALPYVIDKVQVLKGIRALTSANCFGAMGTIYHFDHIWRIDRQPAKAGFVNLQVQRNGVGAPSTVCGVLVPTKYNGVGPKTQPNGDPHHQNNAKHHELTSAIRRTLAQSLATHKVVAGAGATFTLFELYGPYSA